MVANADVKNLANGNEAANPVANLVAIENPGLNAVANGFQSIVNQENRKRKLFYFVIPY